MGYKIARLCFATLRWRPALLSLSLLEESVSVMYTGSLSLKAPHPPLHSVLLELGVCKLHFPDSLLARFPWGSLSRRTWQETTRWQDERRLFLFPDPARHLPEARQLRFQPQPTPALPVPTMRYLIRGTRAEWPIRSELKHWVYTPRVLVLATVYPPPQLKSEYQPLGHLPRCLSIDCRGWSTVIRHSLQPPTPTSEVWESAMQVSISSSLSPSNTIFPFLFSLPEG